MAPSSDKASFRAALASAKSVIILSGAGLSAASGIPTYRNSDNSLWNNFDPNTYATLQAFKDDPVGVWKFYHRRRSEYLLAKPNDAHRALAALAYAPTSARIAPDTKRPLHVTQNIDALALRVLETLPTEAGAAGDATSPVESLIEMHGDMFITRCTSCQHIQRSYAPVLAAALAQLETQDPGEASGTAITIDQIPKCGGDAWAGSNRYGKCGGLLRPEVVWFGEVPPLMGEIARKMSGCDLLLVVGTSSTVVPAASFASQVKKNGGTVAVFNLGRSIGDEEADYVFLGPCEETLPDVLDVQEDMKQLWPDV
ncbi:DHS-like NAD/FAD-binding domain-containing protein [Lyophyllum atratum]|nr:DHS-like NAD/FAD-binding domain-containing protein [Lyophyllum atratum]